MSDVWQLFDDAGVDPLAAPDPPVDVDRLEEFEDRRVDTDWWADGG